MISEIIYQISRQLQYDYRTTSFLSDAHTDFFWLLRNVLRRDAPRLRKFEKPHQQDVFSNIDPHFTEIVFAAGHCHRQCVIVGRK